MKPKKFAITWLMSLALTVLLGTISGQAQSTVEQTREEQAATQEMPEMEELSEEEAAILADALERIQMLREREKLDQRRAAAAAAAGEIDRDADLDESSRAAEAAAAEKAAADQVRKSLEQAVEEHAEQVAGAVEAWGEKFGAEAENWAESFAEDMEAWAEDYSENWEQWAEQHGEKWEQWADEFAGKWEAWSQQLENAEVSKEEMGAMLHENLEMIQQMPLSELYGQLSKSSQKFKDLPWDRLREIEDIVQQSVRHSLESVEQLGQESANTEEQQDRIRLLQKSLKQLNDGLSAKRAELEAAAAQMMGELNKGDVEQAKARAKEAQQRLAELYERARAEQGEAAESLDKRRTQMDARRLKQLKLRQEIAEQVAIDHHEQELTSMRAEIEALRAEIEHLRAKQAAERASAATPPRDK